MYNEIVSGIVALVLIAMAVIAQRKNISIRDMFLGKGESGFENRVEVFAAVSTVVEVLYLANQGMDRGMTASNAYFRYGLVGIMEILFAYNVAHFVSRAVEDGEYSLKEGFLTFLLYCLSFAWTCVIALLYLESIDVVILKPSGISSNLDNRIEIGALVLIFSTQILSLFTIAFGVRRAKRIRDKLAKKGGSSGGNPNPQPNQSSPINEEQRRRMQSEADKVKNLDQVMAQEIRDNGLDKEPQSTGHAKDMIMSYLNKYLSVHKNEYDKNEIERSDFDHLAQDKITALYKFAYLGGSSVESTQLSPDQKRAKHKSIASIALARLGINEKKQVA